jgi:DNA repair protein RecO (recombination protein O)
MRVTLQPAFVLHTRIFGDSSLLVDLFTLNYGIITAIAKGVRAPKAKLRGLLLPFVPLLISWSGKTELYHLSKVEPHQVSYCLLGKSLVCGFYLNELLLRLLHHHDAHPELFHIYQTTIAFLNQAKNIQIALRLFEKRLLMSIGYGLSLTEDVENQKIIHDATYYYVHEQGFVRSNDQRQQLFSGNSLLALHHEQFADSAMLREVKILLRNVIAKRLDRPLKTPELLNG